MWRKDVCKKKKEKTTRRTINYKNNRLWNKSREEESFLGKYIIHFDRRK